MSTRIFVTGATGYLGHAIATRLARAGHEVFGLTRNDKSAAVLESAGLHPVVGDLDDRRSYLAALKNCDAMVHAAVDYEHASTTDQSAIEAVRQAAEDGRVRRFLYTSGVWVLGATGETVADETSPLAAAEVVRWRPAHEEVALDLETVEVATVVIRPGMVYGGAGGTFGEWFQEARQSRTITYAGDGSQHWTMVHVEDVAEAYHLAFEHAKGGERYLLVDPSQHTVRELAEAAALAASATARPSDPDELVRSRGNAGAALLLDQRASAAKARRELGWVPSHPSFVAEAPALYREWLAGQRAPVA